MTGTNKNMVDQFFKYMHLLEVKYPIVGTKFLGMVVTYDTEVGYTLNQEQCIRELLVTTGLELSNSARTPVGDDQDSKGESYLLPEGSGRTQDHPTISTFQYLIG